MFVHLLFSRLVVPLCMLFCVACLKLCLIVLCSSRFKFFVWLGFLLVVVYAVVSDVFIRLVVLLVCDSFVSNCFSVCLFVCLFCLVSCLV